MTTTLSLSDPPVRATRFIIVLACSVLASLTLFGNSVHGDFIYDDRPIITENPLIRTLPRALHVFTTSYWTSDLHRPSVRDTLYRPLTSFSYAINYSVSGLSSFGYRLTNILLHALVVTAVFYVALALGFTVIPAAVAAIFFLVCPVHAEAVCNVVGRAEILATLFVLWAWIVLFNETRPARVALGGVLFLFAMLSKENGVMLLPLWILSETVLSETWKDTIRRRAPVWLALTLLLALNLGWRHVLLGHSLATGSTGYFSGRPPLVILLTMSRFFFWNYLTPMWTGLHLCADYSRPAIPDATLHDLGAWLALTGLIALIALSVFGTFVRRNRAALSLFLFFILLIPISNLVIPIEVIGAERFLYLPSVAMGLFLGWESAALMESLPSIRIPSIVVLTGLGFFLARQTFERSRMWSTPELFWRTTVQDAPQSPRAWNGMGIMEEHQQHWAEARLLFQKALALDPTLIDAQYNLAETSFLEGNLKDAEAGFLAVLRQGPWEKDSLLYLAVIAEKQNDPHKAAWYYSDVLKVDPYNATAHRNLGLILCRAKEWAACRNQLDAYLATAPADENVDGIRDYLARLPATAHAH